MSKKDIYMPEHLTRDEEGNITKREDVTLVTEDYSVKTQGTTLDKKLAEITDEIDVKWGKDELELGGRNFILGSDLKNGYEYAGFRATYGELSVTSDYKLKYEDEIKNTDSSNRWELVINLKKGLYTLSFDLLNTDCDLVLRSWGGNTSIPYQEIPKSSEWKKIRASFYVNQDGSNILRFYTKNPMGNEVTYTTGWKIEKGSIATPWTPAPEDINGIQTQPAPLANMAHIEYLENQIKELREMIALRGLSR